MNSKKTNQNTLSIEEMFKKATNNNKKSSTSLSSIKFNQEELDILSKEVLGENDIQIPKEENNQININLSNDEINTLLKEINNNNDSKKDIKH